LPTFRLIDTVRQSISPKKNLYQLKFGTPNVMSPAETYT